MVVRSVFEKMSFRKESNGSRTSVLKASVEVEEWTAPSTLSKIERLTRSNSEENQGLPWGKFFVKPASVINQRDYCLEWNSDSSSTRSRVLSPDRQKQTRTPTKISLAPSPWCRTEVRTFFSDAVHLWTSTQLQNTQVAVRGDSQQIGYHKNRNCRSQSWCEKEIDRTARYTSAFCWRGGRLQQNNVTVGHPWFSGTNKEPVTLAMPSRCSSRIAFGPRGGNNSGVMQSLFIGLQHICKIEATLSGFKPDGT